MGLYGLKCGDFMRQFWRFYESNDTATLHHHRSRPVLLGVETYAHLESAREVLLSRTPLDLVTDASHHT